MPISLLSCKVYCAYTPSNGAMALLNTISVFRISPLWVCLCVFVGLLSPPLSFFLGLSLSLFESLSLSLSVFISVSLCVCLSVSLLSGPSLSLSLTGLNEPKLQSLENKVFEFEFEFGFSLMRPPPPPPLSRVLLLEI